MTCYWETEAHKKLAEQSKTVPHLRELLSKDDGTRSDKFTVEAENLIFDYTHEKVTPTVLNSLFDLAEQCGVPQKITSFANGTFMNETENRHVLHMALRAAKKSDMGGKLNQEIGEVHDILEKIKKFTTEVRNGSFRGFTNKSLTDVICIGIGGSYLGPEFIYEAMKTYKPCEESAKGRRLRFLANVDPIDVARACQELNPETTLVVIVSKTFTTAETMLNARTLRSWLLETLKDEKAIAHHMIGVTTNEKAVREFGMSTENIFGFWDWVGGRFSVTSAVGCVPLALHYGFDHVQDFLDGKAKGCRVMDDHFFTAPLTKNLPVLMGLISIWNSTYLGYSNVAVLPYCQALLRFSAHIQQLIMESNGKRVTMNGIPLPQDTCEIYFGEPGTNGQHSFYQLLHQGRVIPAEFIAFCKSQNPIRLAGEPVSNHDELMSNFFAQADALAMGKTEEQCKAEGVPQHLLSHKVFTGDRPSSSLLIKDVCRPYSLGLLLSLYEHRTAVQGFVWGNNSFDQWGVELGKALAKSVREILKKEREAKDSKALDQSTSIPQVTRRLLRRYLDAST